MNRKIATVALLLLCSCSAIRTHEGKDAQDVLPSIVQVFNTETGVMLSPPEKKGGKPKMGKEEDRTGTGTGFVVGDLGEGSLVVTAAHVISNPLFQPQEDGRVWISPESKLSISTLDGTKCDATLVRADMDHDLALLKTVCHAGVPVRKADSMPPVGAAVTIVGAPQGFHLPNVFFVSDGRYLGMDKDKTKAYTSCPVSFGNSGSPVFRDGEVIGLLNKMDGDFNHISIIVPLDILSTFMAGKTTEN